MFRQTLQAAFSITVATGLAWSAPSFAESRGLNVDFRTEAKADAPIAETVQLYNGSYALVIGIDNYTNGWPRLSNAVEDAEQVAMALETKGFDVNLVIDLDAAELERALEEFFLIRGANPDARLFVWFAGHGHSEGGEGYLVPADAGRPDEDPRFRVQALTMRRFGEYVRLAQSKHVLAVFDSCFSGTIFETQRSIIPAAITRATALPVRQFVTSGDAGQLVSDDGTFRELFLRALEGEEQADANSDGYLTATELGLYMSNRVTNLTNGRQTPRYGKLRDKDYDRGDFVFAAFNTPTYDAAPRQETKMTEGAGRSDLELEFWREVKNSENADALEAYLTQFPDGTFSPLAEQRLAALNTRAIRLDPEASAAKPAPMEETPAPQATPQAAQPPAQSNEPIRTVPETQAPPAATQAALPSPASPDAFNGGYAGEIIINEAALVYPACTAAFLSGVDFEFRVNGARLAGSVEARGAFHLYMQTQTDVDPQGKFVASMRSAQTASGLGYIVEVRGDLATGTGTWYELRHRCRGTVTFAKVN
jgi:uncharacterized caspase-like protein